MSARAAGRGTGSFFHTVPRRLSPGTATPKLLGTSTAYPEEDLANEYFEAEAIEDVVLPNGTKATLGYMVPAGRAGSQGPFWEGKFDKRGFTYNLMVVKPNEITEGQVRRTLSTMVLVPDSGDETAAEEVEPVVEEAVENYYYAVDYERWGYTCDNLDSESKSLFTEEEWFKKNQYFADTEDLELDSMDVEVVVDPGGFEADVTADRAFKDGRDTVFVLEGAWKHHLTEEEREIFMPGVPYEEFVEAQ